MALTDAQLAAAISANPIEARRLGWADRINQINELLGFHSTSPSPAQFAQAVADWQATHPPLIGDGILGRNTWGRMQQATAFTPTTDHEPVTWLCEDTSSPETQEEETQAAATPDARVRELIRAWVAQYGPNYGRLATYLYQVRNPGFNGSPPLSHWPEHLIGETDEINAAVEHYFLCRSLVGSGAQPAWQMRLQRDIYEMGKRAGITPRHNPDNPTTPPSALQRRFQDEGIADGERDLAASGDSAPLVAPPLTY